MTDEQWSPTQKGPDSKPLVIRQLFGLRRPPEQHALGPKGLKLLQRWLKDCLTNHMSCNTTAERFLPRRVIDLSGSAEAKIPYLYETQGELADYACLGHCWGSGRHLLTTTNNIASMRKALPEDIPSTFRDAFTIATRLGIRYLWIDSLCIVQDDRNDWARQSSHMAEIYGNSLLTIAATYARNDADECLTFPNGRLSQETLHFVGSGQDDSQGFHVCPTDTSTAKLPHNDWGSSKVMSDMVRDVIYSRQPLTERAWTLQEHHLSPRVLQFGPEEMVWDCNERALCECGIADDMEPSDRGSVWGIKNAWNNLENSQQYWLCDRERRQCWQDMWLELVREYTSRNLSVESDKLPAFSGLAQVWQKRVNGHYLAGIWREDLLDSLFWCTFGWYSPPPRPSQYRAPSWSWASVESRVYFPVTHIATQPLTEKVNIIDVQCEVAEPDPTGAVISGFLDVHAALLSVRIGAEMRYQKGAAAWCGLYISHTLPLLFEHSVGTGSTEAILAPDYDLTAPGSWQVTQETQLYCFALGLSGGWCLNESYTYVVLRKSPAWPTTYQWIGLSRLEEQDHEIIQAARQKSVFRII